MKAIYDEKRNQIRLEYDDFDKIPIDALILPMKASIKLKKELDEAIHQKHVHDLEQGRLKK